MGLVCLVSAPRFVFSQEVPGRFTIVEPTEEELFRPTFSNDTFTSEYFGFSISIPEKWHRMAEPDTRIRQETKDLVTENSNIDVSKLSSARSNMFTFSIKPHGSPNNHRILCTVRKAPASGVSAEQKSIGLEKALSLMPIFMISEKTQPVTLGENTFYMFEAVATINGKKATQAAYHILRKGYLLTFTLGYDKKTKPVLVDSLKTLKFEKP
jgi:hypothetical protein